MKRKRSQARILRPGNSDKIWVAVCSLAPNNFPSLAGWRGWKRSVSRSKHGQWKEWGESKGKREKSQGLGEMSVVFASFLFVVFVDFYVVLCRCYVVLHRFLWLIGWQRMSLQTRRYFNLVVLSKNQFCKEKEKKKKQKKECWVLFLCDAKQLLWVSCKVNVSNISGIQPGLRQHWKGWTCRCPLFRLGWMVWWMDALIGYAIVWI